MEYSRTGKGLRAKPYDDQPNLACFRLAAPHTESFKLSPGPLLIEKVRDIVGLYMNPPDHAMVSCVDEKSQIQALDRTQFMPPMRPGQLERRTHDYKRPGTTSLFAALELKTSRVIGQLHAIRPYPTSDAGHGGRRTAPGSRIETFRASWIKAAKDAGHPTLLFHDLRRSAARNLIRLAGLSEKWAIEISGHRTDAVIRRYNIKGNQDAQRLGKRLDEFWKKETSAKAKLKVERNAQPLNRC